MSAPASARDNHWRQARAISDESPEEATRIAKMLQTSSSQGVHEEVIRSCLTILQDPAVVVGKGSICAFLADLSRHPSSPSCLFLMGEGVLTLASQVSTGDDICRAHALQGLMNLGKSPEFHPEVIMVLVEILRDREVSPKIKANVCRALNVVSFYDDGQEIVNIGAVTDIALAMSEDPSWDSFAARTLMQLTEDTTGRDDKVINAVLQVCSGQYSSTAGPYRSHLVRIMAVLSDKDKAQALQSPSGVERSIPVVAELLKEEEVGARAYACETLHNISKKDRTVFLPDGRGKELVGSFVIRALIDVLKSGETDPRVTANTMEKACRLVCYVMTDARGAWKTSLNGIYDEAALIEELGKVVRESNGPGKVGATEWAIDALLRGTRGMKAIKRREVIKEKAGEALRYVLDEGGDTIGAYTENSKKTLQRIHSIMSVCKIPRESEEAELTRNLNIIKRNVGVSVGGLVPGDPSPYVAEKGERVYKAMVAIRKCVSSSSDAVLNANCREICESGVLQCMVVLLGNEAADKYPRLELETAWVCTNLASGLSEFCVSLVQSGIVPCLVHLLCSSDLDVQDQALWALANLAGDGAYCRDAVIHAGVVSAIQRAHPEGILDHLKPMSDLAFLCRNIMKTKPLPPLQKTKGIIPVLSAFLHRVAVHQHQKSHPQAPARQDYGGSGTGNQGQGQGQGRVEEILMSVLHAFLGFTSQDERGELSMDIIIDTGCMPIIVQLIRSHLTIHDSGKVTGNAELVDPALKILDQFCSGSEKHTQHIIDIDGIDVIFKCTAMDIRNIRKVAWFTLSNLAAGSPAQVQCLVQKGIFNRVYDVLTNTDWSTNQCGTLFFTSQDLNIKEDITWCLGNVFDPDEITLETKANMMAVLNCNHSQAGDHHDEEDSMHGITAIFEATHILISSDIHGGDRQTRIELASKLMKILEIITGPAMLSPRINAKLKKSSKRVIAILQACLQQHSTNLSRLTESVCDQVLMRIAEA